MNATHNNTADVKHTINTYAISTVIVFAVIFRRVLLLLFFSRLQSKDNHYCVQTVGIVLK